MSTTTPSTRHFATAKWQTLEKKLGEWKAAVVQAREAIGEAETFAALPPGSGRSRRDGGGGQQGQQQQQQQQQEIAA